MGLFGGFDKKKVELTEDQKKWNKMWDLWVNGQAESPYAELMTYHSEVNNGGHGQYFDNVGNNGDVRKEMDVLKTVLPARLKSALEVAYQAHLALEKKESALAEADLEKCDNTFYDYEGELSDILKEYAARIEL